MPFVLREAAVGLWRCGEYLLFRKPEPARQLRNCVLCFSRRCGISLPTAFKLVPVKRSALTPELKAFIDHAVVPALVKAYLAARGEG